MDDASRLLTHTAFCTGEKALNIEGVLKQAILKRSVPIKLVVDNEPGYRAKTLQGTDKLYLVNSTPKCTTQVIK